MHPMERTQVKRRRGRAPSAASAAPVYAVTAALGSLVLAALTLELWRADFGVPWTYSHDAFQNLMLVKSTLQHGWYLHNSSLGFPFGQNMRDFPVVEGDTTKLLLIKAIGIFSSNPAAVANVYFLLTFPLTGFVAWWALRRLQI